MDPAIKAAFIMDQRLMAASSAINARHLPLDPLAAAH